MEFSGLLKIYSYITCAFAALFLYQTLVNFSISRLKIIKPGLIKAHLGLCAFSTLYTCFVFLILMKPSVTINLVIMHFLWMSGSLVNFFYIRAVKRFLKDDSDNLKWIQLLPLLSGAGALFCLAYWGVTGIPLLLDPSHPYTAYNNLFMNYVGGFSASKIVQFLGLLIFIPLVYSSIYFIRIILKSAKPDTILLLGVGFTLLATVNDLIISVWDLTYLLPFMFAANVFEILRITHYNQRKLAHELYETTRDLIDSAKLSEIGSSYAMLAHEILNPLQAASGYLEKLNRILGPEHRSIEIQACLDKISKQHGRIEVLARNVKRYAKTNSQFEPLEADLDDIIQESLETVGMKAKSAGVEIRYNSVTNHYKIDCLYDQMIQVFTNLLNNSIEAVHPLEDRWIEIDRNVDAKSKKIIISIKDSGQGISPNLAARIWEHRFTTKKDNGVGLGLSLCRSIIDKHGGLIYLSKDSGHTQFIVELPLKSADFAL